MEGEGETVTVVSPASVWVWEGGRRRGGGRDHSSQSYPLQSEKRKATILSPPTRGRAKKKITSVRVSALHPSRGEGPLPPHDHLGDELLQVGLVHLQLDLLGQQFIDVASGQLLCVYPTL